MATKVIIDYAGAAGHEKVESLKKIVADALGICCEDVVFIPGVRLQVVEVPDDLTAARAKADKEAEKAEKAKVEAEEKAAAATEKAEKAAAAKVEEPVATHAHAHHGKK